MFSLKWRFLNMLEVILLWQRPEQDYAVSMNYDSEIRNGTKNWYRTVSQNCCRNHHFFIFYNLYWIFGMENLHFWKFKDIITCWFKHSPEHLIISYCLLRGAIKSSIKNRVIFYLVISVTLRSVRWDAQVKYEVKFSFTSYKESGPILSSALVDSLCFLCKAKNKVLKSIFTILHKLKITYIVLLFQLI